MSLSARPQWKAAKAGDDTRGNVSFVKSGVIQVRSLPQQQTLKFRVPKPQIQKKQKKDKNKNNEFDLFQNKKPFLMLTSSQKEKSNKVQKKKILDILGTGSSSSSGDSDSENEKEKNKDQDEEEEFESLLQKYQDLDKDDSTDSDSSEQSGEESTDSEDEEALLMKELEKLKKEKEEKKRLEEERKLKEMEEQQNNEILDGNQLLNLMNKTEEKKKDKFTIKRRWDEDVVFSNTIEDEPKKRKRVINDTIRNDYHIKFMNRYLK
ncbi:spliceosome-associated protein cwc15 [Anaeramoeba flamelloides]|uniref:Spliceosome-associated protein cwc15 n=1 Tax=Anaeramoeba flamelloides TaxID=1746091 RepID=A0ABQ8XQS6_9EUKA|nr:spliceosome-associated protein cwc15 [Anaeramoeba flamelloides]